MDALKLTFARGLIMAEQASENNISADLDSMFTELIKILNKYQDEVLFKKAKFNIVKQYKLKPIKKLSELKYYFMKISYLMTGAI